jgi:2-polyprenyl-6-hydroxyphenyl methylase/3-demethylubiquinone-9 3-methyltransferase
MTEPLNAQQRLRDFRPEVLDDRHDRQFSLLEATGALPPPPYRVLDLGSGSGVTAVWAARRGWHVTAVDADPGNMAVLHEYLSAHEQNLRIETIVADATSCAGVPEATYDIAYLKDLLEHVEDYAGCLSAAHRSLKPGGLLYVATTNVVCPIQLEYHGVGPYSWYPRPVKDWIRRYAMTRRPAIVNYTPYPAVHWFSRRTLARACREAGFSRVWSLYDLVSSPRDLTRRSRIAYPLVRYARTIAPARWLADIALPGLTMVAQR